MIKILIVDDDPVSAKLIEYTLLKNAYTVIVCTDGAEVIEQVEKEKPALIILDLYLPNKTGLELTKELRANPEFSATPIIIITEQGRDSISDQLINAGAWSVYTKPFSPIQLINRIKDIFSEIHASTP